MNANQTCPAVPMTDEDQAIILTGTMPVCFKDDWRDADIMFNAMTNPHGLTPRQRRRAIAFAGMQNQPL